MSLFRVVYLSRAVGAAAHSLLPLSEILGVSERNNRRDHLTGLLMRQNGLFLQAIEGGRADIDRLMRRLAADPRHADMRILSDSPATARRFGDWAMGQGRIEDGAPDGGLVDALDAATAERMLAAACRSMAAAPRS